MQFNKEIRMEKMNVKPATGKLGVLCVGLGAVTSTFMTGVLMARKGLAKPVGSMISYSVHGMFIRLMPMSQLLMQKFCKRKISIL